MGPLVLALSSFFRLQPHGWPVPAADLAFLRPFQHPLPTSQDQHFLTGTFPPSPLCLPVMPLESGVPAWHAQCLPNSTLHLQAFARGCGVTSLWKTFSRVFPTPPNEDQVDQVPRRAGLAPQVA